MIKVAFLDRDGVINYDLGYVHNRENFHFVNGIANLLTTLLKTGYEIIVVTNQSGIGRGYYSEVQYQKLTEWYLKYLKQKGIVIKDVLHCPHFLTSGHEKYAVNCNCRKPSPGLLEIAKQKYDIDMNSSFIIGDKTTDMLAGSRAGLRRGFLFNSLSTSDKDSDLIEIQMKMQILRVRSLPEVTSEIKKIYND